MVVDSLTVTPKLQDVVTGPQLRVDTGAPYDVYFQGLVAVTHGSKQVQGFGTGWEQTAAGLPTGVRPRFLSVRGDQESFYEIDSLSPKTQDGPELMTLKEPFCGPTMTSTSYTIWFFAPGSETKEVAGGCSVVLDISALPFEQMCAINHNVALLDKAIAAKLGIA